MKRIVTASVCLLTGAVMYLLLRDRSLLGFSLLDHLGAGAWADRARAAVAGTDLPEWVIYCLPDGLWALSYILLIDVIMERQPFHKRMAWTSVIPLIGTASELLQAIGWTPGVYDMIDLICYLLPLVIYAAWQMLLHSNNR